jgi:predicted RNA-binding Zn-ribbon protein involved in translation (DUF1610 family)
VADSEKPDNQAVPVANQGASPAGKANSRLPLLIAVGLLAAVAGGYMVWDARGKEDPTALKSKFACVTQGCSFEEARPLKVGESMPLQCPRCGKNSLYVSHTCPQCGQPNVMNETRGLTGPTQCSRCGTEIRHGE